MSVYIHPAVRHLCQDITTIHQRPDNPNEGDMEAIRESILVNGFIVPIVVSTRTRQIVDGNHRYAVMLEQGMDRIPAVEVDRDQDDDVRFSIAANETARRGRWNESMLLDDLTRLRNTETGLLGTGHDELDYMRLLAQVAENERTPIGEGHGYGQAAALGIYQVVIEVPDEDTMHDLAAELSERPGLEGNVREVTL